MNYLALLALVLTGNFTKPHPIAFLSYDNAQSCEADKGRWDGDVCLFDAEDSVKVTKQADGTFGVTVSTVTTNAHTCDFEANGKLVAKNEILATAPADEGKTCSLRLSYGADDTLSVSPLREDDCRYFCGAGASLAISKAKRR